MDILSSNLADKRLQVLGGIGTKGELEKLRAEHAEAVEMFKTVDLALDKMRQIHTKAVKNEKESKLEQLRADRVQLSADADVLIENLLKSADKAPRHFPADWHFQRLSPVA